MIPRKTHEIFLEQMKEKHPNITVLGFYKNNHSSVLCKCNIDGYEWKGIPNKMLDSGHGCPKCGKSLKLTDGEFKRQMKKINNTIKILGKYINSNTPIEVECKECNNKWMARPYHLKKGKGCPECAKEHLRELFQKDMETFKTEMFYVDPTIIISGDYINTKTKVHCKCTVCDREWDSIPSNLLKGRGCSKCSASKGEKRIMSWLQSNDIEYKTEYSYPDCKYKRVLYFDFYLPKFNCLIEYDGQQHFMPVQMGGISKERAEKLFEENKIRDNIKNEYCKKNNIKLYRINYKQYNDINEILKNIFLI